MKKILNILKSKTLLLGMIASCITTLAPSTAQAQWTAPRRGQMDIYLLSSKEYLQSYQKYRALRGYATGNPELAKRYWTRTLWAYESAVNTAQDLAHYYPELGWYPAVTFPTPVSRFEYQPERDAYQNFYNNFHSNYEWSIHAYIVNIYPEYQDTLFARVWGNYCSAYNAREDYNSNYRSYHTIDHVYPPYRHSLRPGEPLE